MNAYDLKSDTEKLIDYAFFAIQRGEAGHRRSSYNIAYQDAKGINTIGYGTVLDEGYNNINHTGEYASEDTSIEMAKVVMAEKINEKCRVHFKDFDDMLPCYKALIMDMVYQGSWPQIKNTMNAGDYTSLMENVINDTNIERNNVRLRMVEMGLGVQYVQHTFPNANPLVAAHILADNMVEKYAHLNGTDAELTKDELALLYRTCMQAYGVEITQEQVQAFALSYENVASGTAGIGAEHMAPPYDRKLRDAYVKTDFSEITTKQNPTYNEQYLKYIPYHDFEPDSSALHISRDYSAVNKSSRNGELPQMIVIHRTDSPSLESTMNTFTNPAEGTSVHYVIGRDGKIYQLVAESECAHHAGESYRIVDGKAINGVNSASIGIELQCAPDEDFTMAQIASVSALTKDISDRNGIAKEHIIGHEDVSGRRKGGDPGPSFPWQVLREQGIIDMADRASENQQMIAPELRNIISKDCAFIAKEKPSTKSMADKIISDINVQNQKMGALIDSESEKVAKETAEKSEKTPAKKPPKKSTLKTAMKKSEDKEKSGKKEEKSPKKSISSIASNISSTLKNNSTPAPETPKSPTPEPKTKGNENR